MSPRSWQVWVSLSSLCISTSSLVIRGCGKGHQSGSRSWGPSPGSAVAGSEIMDGAFAHGEPQFSTVQRMLATWSE